MVGVPGRSKGCITCRRRKKGCDKKTPFCGQCIALNIPCEGYDRQPIWLNSEGSTQTSYTKSPPRDGRDVKPSLKRPDSSVIILHESLTRTARTQKFTGLFWMDYLSGGNGFSLKASGTTSFQRMRLYEDLSVVEPALQYVAMALSTATLGANNNDIQLQRKSQHAYGLALRQMAISLNSCRQNKDGMLAAIQLMRVYEQLFGANYNFDPTKPTVQGFTKHIDGETALILSRGPEDSWSAMGRQLLADGRLTLINAYTSRRKGSPFNRRQWKQSQLWLSVTDSPLNKLVDILVEVPGLLEDLDVLRQALHKLEAESLADALMNKCHSCEKSLLSWEMEVGDILTIYDYTVAGEVLPLPKDDDDLAVVYLSCYYWMTRLFLHSTIGFCELEGPNIDVKRSLMDFPSQQIATSYAYRIAHAIHLLFEPPAGDYSSVAVFFPLGNAIRYLIMTETYGGQSTISNERLLLRKIFASPFLGSFVGKFLQSLQADDGVDYGYPAERLVGMAGVEYRARVWWCGIQRAGLPKVPLTGACR